MCFRVVQFTLNDRFILKYVYGFISDPDKPPSLLAQTVKMSISYSMCVGGGRTENPKTTNEQSKANKTHLDKTVELLK